VGTAAPGCPSSAARLGLNGASGTVEERRFSAASGCSVSGSGFSRAVQTTKKELLQPRSGCMRKPGTKVPVAAGKTNASPPDAGASKLLW